MNVASRAEMTCEEATPLLPMVADGAIDDVADPALFAHLSRCCDCQENLAQHDLINVSLAASRPPVRSTAIAKMQPLRYVFLPWPATLAASLVAAVGLWMWLTTLQNNRSVPIQPITQVHQVMTNDGHVVYVVVENGQLSVIDPRTLDGKMSSDATNVQAVKFLTPHHGQPTTAP
jgi:hypothetical protein